MKKLLIAGFSATALLLASAQTPALADAPPVAGVGSGSAAATTAIFLSGELGIAALTYAIATGVDPWSPLFKKVTYTYPEGTNGQ